MKSWLVGVVLSCPLVASAEEIKAPKPSNELQAIKPWLKTWTCSGVNGVGEKVSGLKMIWKLDVNDAWVALRFEAKKTPKLPAILLVGYAGPDPMGKGWTMDHFSNFGGHSRMRAPSVTATAMDWTGEEEEAGTSEAGAMRFTLDPKTRRIHTTGEAAGKKTFDLECT